MIEGIDGSGKTTVAARTAALLQEDGCNVLLTREPGGTQDGNIIRSQVTSGSLRDVPDAEFLLFAADRALHVERVVVPALKQGIIVICDRMGDSSYAYQGFGRGVNLEMITAINRWVMRSLEPSLTVYLMIDYATAQSRISTRRNHEATAYDHERTAFFRNVARGYEALYADKPSILRLDSKLTIETNAQTIYQRICNLMDT